MGAPEGFPRVGFRAGGGGFSAGVTDRGAGWFGVRIWRVGAAGGWDGWVAWSAWGRGRWDGGVWG